ncbi:MAG: C-type lectin domain-containing protein [Pseudomonadota bacterium]
MRFRWADWCSDVCVKECNLGAVFTTDGDIAGTGHCTFVLDAEMFEGAGWSAAFNGCEAYDAHMVTITSADENNFVRQVAMTYPWNTHFWIGLMRDWAGEFYWNTGEPYHYTNWYADPVEYFATMKTSEPYNGRWLTAGCANAFPVVCEHEW